MEHVVGMGDYKITNNTEDTIKTYALATCMGVTVYHPTKKVAGMIHVVSPEPYTNMNIHNPVRFATIGIRMMVEDICNKYKCNTNELVARIYGGMRKTERNDIFGVSEKNLKASQETLESMGIHIVDNDYGGEHSRTITLEVKTGNVSVQYSKMKYK